MVVSGNSMDPSIAVSYFTIVFVNNSKACNFVVHSELGQFSLLITTLTTCLNFWLHITQ